ncbi:PAS domain S-box-containing protein [Geodermatophilus tzadiensis]|uniref:PAS domain S-box-containing protein n=1 Tax=Geodermatophilus tzadiensis TaxID=1137988 RepID=A0A2T0TWE1_9ACTN|nr:ANTAR domain-containing protein [Geodermatophilus tzadiensis]PRY49975.1 PAS domain S-box-containing protein [Geodermatophilus tzadiensis]
MDDRGGTGPASDLPVAQVVGTLAELSVAQEELRVAEEELLAQQEEIARLVERYDGERRWREHLTAVLPVGLFVTDGAGKVLEANPALAGLLGVALPRLLGKPFTVYLAPADVPGFRAAVRELAAGEVAEHRAAVTLHGRNGVRAEALLSGVAETSGGGPAPARLQWVLTTDPEDAVLLEPLPATEPAPPGDDAAPIGIAEALAELTRLASAGADRRQLLGRMATLAQRAVPSSCWVSVTIGSPRDPRYIGTDSTAAQEADGRQMRADEGPCVDAYTGGEAVVTGELRTDPRWPVLARLAAAGPVRSVLAVPVALDGAPTGVLNVYSPRVDAFGPADRRVAELVALAAAAVLQEVAERESLRRLTANLEQALASRSVIDQAKGVLMSRLGVDADDAWARLVTLSNRLNVKVRDLARLVVEGHADEVIAAAAR